MKPLFLIISLCVVCMICSSNEDLSLYDSENASSQTMEEYSKMEAKLPQSTQNLSFKADAFANDGYSELELETGKTIANGIEAPMSRYGVGMNLSYLVQAGSRVKFDFLFSNGLEINSQRRGGKIKSYDNALQYESSAYDYGNKVMYATWVNSISMVVTILEAHHIMLAFKQTQLPINNQPLGLLDYNFDIQSIGSFNGFVSSMLKDNPYSVMTQIFLTYNYIF